MIFLALQAFLSLSSSAIPNAVGGFLAQAESPLNETEISNHLLDPAVWSGERELPGKWRQEAPIASVKGVITSGVLLTVILFGVINFLI